MSVTIMWRLQANDDKSFDGGTSTDLENLKRIFRGSINTVAEVEKLRAMAVAGNNSFYDEVADVVEKHGAIDFWGEW